MRRGGQEGRTAPGGLASVSEFYLNERQAYSNVKGPPCVRCRNGAWFQECRTVYTDKTQTSGNAVVCRRRSAEGGKEGGGACGGGKNAKTDKWNTWGTYLLHARYETSLYSASEFSLRKRKIVEPSTHVHTARRRLCVA